MASKIRVIALLQCLYVHMSKQSITGVTYMDHFDFEERYRDVRECDPFFWHPLHLPEYCAEMYEKLIRSRLASRTPARVYTEKKTSAYKLDSNYNYPVSMYEIDPPVVYAEKPQSLYEKMMESLKRDIMESPTAPVMQMMPNLGPVAVYKQPISKKSRRMIKIIAKAYAKAGRRDSVEQGGFYGNIEISPPSDKETKENNGTDALPDEA